MAIATNTPMLLKTRVTNAKNEKDLLSLTYFAIYLVLGVFIYIYWKNLLIKKLF